jgi:FdhE protein
VGAEFIRKFVRRAPTPQSLARASGYDAIGEAIEQLGRLADERPELRGAAEFLRDVLPGLYAEPIEPVAPVLTGEQASAKLERGAPLLRGETIPLDAAAFSRRWMHVCAALERRQESRAAGKALAQALRGGSLVPSQLTEAVLAGLPDVIHTRADALRLDAELTATVLRLTLFPVLCQVDSGLAPLRVGRRWERGYCPTCGSWPLLGEFRGLEQTRFLRCGLCAAAWEFPRLRCPFCDTSDHRQLGYFYAEAEEGKYRAATCAVCRGYVKMLSTLTELTPAMLLAANIATLHLDLVAADRGYGRSREEAGRDQLFAEFDP